MHVRAYLCREVAVLISTGVVVGDVVVDIDCDVDFLFDCFCG